MSRIAQASGIAGAEEFRIRRDVVTLLVSQIGAQGMALPAFLSSINSLGAGATTGLIRKTAANTAALLDYSVGTFVPTFTFATPGDLSVVYTTQEGIYVQIGGLVFVSIHMAFTPTHTTASGNASVAGLPFPAIAGQTAQVLTFAPLSALTWPASTSSCWGQLAASASAMNMLSVGTAAGAQAWGVTQFPTATARTLRFAGTYRTA